MQVLTHRREFVFLATLKNWFSSYTEIQCIDTVSSATQTVCFSSLVWAGPRVALLETALELVKRGGSEGGVSALWTQACWDENRKDRREIEMCSCEERCRKMTKKEETLDRNQRQLLLFCISEEEEKFKWIEKVKGGGKLNFLKASRSPTVVVSVDSSILLLPTEQVKNSRTNQKSWFTLTPPHNVCSGAVIKMPWKFCAENSLLRWRVFGLHCLVLKGGDAFKMLFNRRSKVEETASQLWAKKAPDVTAGWTKLSVGKMGWRRQDEAVWLMLSVEEWWSWRSQTVVACRAAQLSVCESGSC